jgi:hypothetical protein
MVVLLGVLVAEVAAYAGFAPPWSVDPNDPIGLDPNAAWRLPGGDFGESRYRNEGAEVVPWTQETALPSPDNAAILYYQAFLLRPEPDEATSLRINRVLRGDLPDASIRVYLGDCRRMIHTAEVASRVPQCTWGVRRFDAGGFGEMDLIGQIRQLAIVLALDARTLGVDGHYDAAFARCLTMRRVARHVGDETMVAYLLARSAEELANHTMRYLLGLAPADADLIQQVRGQLAAVPGAPRPFEKVVQSDFEQSIESLRRNPTILQAIRLQITKGGDSPTKGQPLNLTDEEILTQARETCLPGLNGVLQAIDSDMPYERKYAEIDRRTQDFAKQHDDDPAASWLWSFVTAHLGERYSLAVRNAAARDAVKTAVEVYLINAQTGRLPETLPPYTAKDPYSGQEFEYEITKGGFVLRCRAQDLYYNQVWQYEFIIRK